MKGVMVILVALVALLGAGVAYQTMQLRSEQSKSKKALTKLDEEETTAKAAQAKAKGTQDEVTELKDKLGAETESSQKLEEDLKVAKQALELGDARDNEKIDELTKENNVLTGKLKALTERLDDLNNKVDTLAKERDQAKKDGEALNKDFAETKRKLMKVSSRRLAWRGTILLETGKPEAAAPQFKAALVTDPGNAEAIKGLALCHEALGKKDDARQCWEAYIKTGPEEGNLKLAREHLEKLKE